MEEKTEYRLHNEQCALIDTLLADRTHIVQWNNFGVASAQRRLCLDHMQLN